MMQWVMQWMFEVHHWNFNIGCSIKNFILYVIENMQELWERALNDLVELLEKGIEVIPPYLVDLFQRYMVYGIFKESFLLLLCIVTIIVCLCIVYKTWKKWDGDDVWMACAILIIPFLIAVIGMIVCWMDLFEAIFIPEVYVIHDLQWCTSCRW